MSVERPESERAEDSGENGGAPEISGLWLMPLLLAGGAGFGLLGGLLGMVLELPRDSNVSLAAILMMVLASCTRRPKTFRQLGLVAAGGAVAGVFAMLGYLLVLLWAQALGHATGSLVVRGAGVVFAAAAGMSVALLAYRWLKLPGPAETRSEDRS